MRLAVSNIAWPAGEDETAAAILREHGATGVEIAPTKLWPKPLEASPAEVRGARRVWEERGLPIVAMQALLFGRPDLAIFRDETRRAALDYLKGILQLAGHLGAKALVFGSPKNRLVGDMPPQEVERIAIAFFRELGEHAERCGVCLCIEPNPEQYGCDWLTTSQPAYELVARVDSPGFGLHLDTGGAALSGDDLAEILPVLIDRVRHFHVSEPFLRPIGDEKVPHSRLAAALERVGYAGWISIEMSEQNFQEPWTKVLADSIDLVRRHYGRLAAAESSTPCLAGT